MYLQKEENGGWFVKLATGFDSPHMINSDNKKIQVFEEYIYTLFSKENLLIQLVWKFDTVKDFNNALQFMDILTNDNKDNVLNKMREYGEFFIYLYKNDNYNRDAKTIEQGEDVDYPKTIDTSHIKVNLFEFNNDMKQMYFEWIKLEQEDFYLIYDSQGKNRDIITTVIDFEKLLKHLEMSQNEVYVEIYKKFNVKYFEDKFPEKNRIAKKSKI